MFNLSGSEVIVILLLALVVLGPEKLPAALRRAGRTYAELKKMGNSFQAEMKSVLDEPMQEMRETADLLKKSVDFTDGEATNRRSPTRLPTAASATTTGTTTTTPAAAGGAKRTATDPHGASAATAAEPGGPVRVTDAATPTAPAPAKAAPAPAAPAAPATTAAPTVGDGPATDDTPTQLRSPEDELIHRTLSGDP